MISAVGQNVRRETELLEAQAELPTPGLRKTLHRPAGTEDWFMTKEPRSQVLTDPSCRSPWLANGFMINLKHLMQQKGHPLVLILAL